MDGFFQANRCAERVGIVAFAANGGRTLTRGGLKSSVVDIAPRWPIPTTPEPDLVTLSLPVRASAREAR
jgi:hypothetical protein